MSIDLPSGLSTESVDPHFAGLDTKAVPELAVLMNSADAAVPAAVQEALPQLIPAIEAICERFVTGGRIIYIGAGTSGRLGVLDASECPPTYNTDPGRVLGIIAGGEVALRDAVEGAEDDKNQGALDLDAYGVNRADAVIGLATSGRTPYVIGALERARDCGAVTVSVACNRDSVVSQVAEFPVEVIVGPEFVAGSTRLKAGTAQKLVLNMISTIAHIRAGKVFDNRMVDVRASNEKLRIRAARMVADLADVDENRARQVLQECHWSVKDAVVAIIRGVSADEAAALLDQADGRLREALTQ